MSRGTWSLTKATVIITFADYSERWLANRRVKGQPLAERTREGYTDLLDRFILPTFGNRLIHTITRDDVDNWYERTAKDTPTYRARATLRVATRWNPPPSKNLAVITDAMPPRYRLLVRLAAWCALRFGELTELRRADIDASRGVIRVRRGVVYVDGRFVVKTSKSAAGVRDVTIPPHLMPLVREHLLAYTGPGPDGLLFPSKNDPQDHLGQSTLTWIYYPARDAAGRPDLHSHDLRHTGLTWAAWSGATLAELMSRAGHSTPAMAIRYQHAAQDRDAIIAQKLSAMVGWEAEQATS